MHTTFHDPSSSGSNFRQGMEGDKEWRGGSDSRQMGLIDSNINHDEFVLMNNVLNEYIKMKEEIKNLQA